CSGTQNSNFHHSFFSVLTAPSPGSRRFVYSFSFPFSLHSLIKIREVCFFHREMYTMARFQCKPVPAAALISFKFRLPLFQKSSYTFFEVVRFSSCCLQLFLNGQLFRQRV